MMNRLSLLNLYRVFHLQAVTPVQIYFHLGHVLSVCVQDKNTFNTVKLMKSQPEQ